MQVDEKHIDMELEYLFQNKEIQQNSYNNYSLKQIKYSKVLLDYIGKLKEKAKNKEINDSVIKIYVKENEEKNIDYNHIINKDDLEFILSDINNNIDNQDININDEIQKTIKNKSIGELLKEIYGQNLIDIKSLIYIFITKDYNKIFNKTFKILQSLEKENIMTISQEDMIKKISADEITTNEFNDYLLLTKYKKYLKNYDSNKSFLPLLLNYLNNNKYDYFKITKKIELEKEKKIKNILMINDNIAVLDEESIKIYSFKYSELIQTLEGRFDIMILNDKKTEFISKLDLSNYAIFIDFSSLNCKQYFFSNSKGKKLSIETSNGKIMMIGSYEIYIYSKYKEIYILEKIINIENPLYIYQFDENYLFIKAGKQENELYKYSINDFNLIKYKTNFIDNIAKINNDIIVSYRSDYFNNSFLNLIDHKTFKIIFNFKIKGKISIIKSIKNNTIMVGTNEKLLIFHLTNNNIIILDKLYEEYNYSYIDYINYMDEDTIILGASLFRKIFYFQNEK